MEMDSELAISGRGDFSFQKVRCDITPWTFCRAIVLRDDEMATVSGLKITSDLGLPRNR